MQAFNQTITTESTLVAHLSKNDINLTDADGNNILLFYLQSKDCTKIKFSIFLSIISTFGIDLQHTNHQRETAISIIINMRTVHPLAVMCGHQEFNLNSPDGNGVYPIFFIIYSLLDIKQSSYPYKKIYKKQLTEIDLLRQMLILLVNHPSFAYYKDDLDKTGNSVLHYAVLYGCTKIIQTLLQNGCNINIGNFLFCFANINLNDSNLKLATLLCEHGADVNHVNENGDTILHVMLINNQLVNPDFQLSKWCSLFMRFGHRMLPNLQGDTPLHIALMFEMFTVLKQLFKSGQISTINVKNNMGNSALELLTNKPYNFQIFEILTLFLKSGNLDISCLFDVVSANNTLTSQIIGLIQSGQFSMLHISTKRNLYPEEIGRLLLRNLYTNVELAVAGRLFDHMLYSRRFDYIYVVKCLNLPIALIRIIIFYILHQTDYFEVRMLYNLWP
jgi:ankyrin repeat protein